MTQSLKWYYLAVKMNTELNTCGILASSNEPKSEITEPGYKQTKNLWKRRTSKSNMYLNTFVILASSNVPSTCSTYTHKHTYIVLVAKGLI